MPLDADHHWRFEWRRSWPNVWNSTFVDRWRAVWRESSSAHVYHRPELVRLWAETVGAALGVDPHVGIASSRSGAAIILPWVVVRYGGRMVVRRTLEPAGRDIFGYHNPLVGGCEPGEIDWTRFWVEARESVSAGCDQALFRLLEPCYAGGEEMRRRSEGSPVLNIHGCSGLDEVLSRCSSSHRIDVKRQFRRARERGEVALWVAGPTDGANALESLRRELWPAYTAVWQARPIKNTLFGPGVASFVEAVVSAGIAAGWCHYSVLRVDDVPIAWHVGFVDGGRFYWWLPTHDQQWSNYSPGKLLLAALVDLGCRSGWTEMHLLTGNHDYKAAWNPTANELTAVAWSAPTLRGRLLAWYDAYSRAS